MEPAHFKSLRTSRGFDYNYYLSPVEDASLPILLFLHGFPTTSMIWREQAIFFCARGFRLLIPDMLGFGGTSKPTDPEAYRPTQICEDILDIMNAEQIDRAVAVGHDLLAFPCLDLLR